MSLLPEFQGPNPRLVLVWLGSEKGPCLSLFEVVAILTLVSPFLEVEASPDLALTKLLKPSELIHEARGYKKQQRG